MRQVVKGCLCPSDLAPDAAFAVPDGFGGSVVTAGPSSYAACIRVDESGPDDPTGAGVFYRNSRTRVGDVTDGLSNTIFVGERAWANAKGIWAGAPAGAVCARGPRNPCPGSPSGSAPAPTLVLAHSHLNNALTDTDGGLDDFSSLHTGGANFLFGDGSVRFVRSVTGDNADDSYTRDSIAFQALGTRAGGEVVTGFDY